ncbi:MAG TPA: TetR/AcrR family transcriptional regulator [Saprospiraceae bacterium]|nr:TetR/AcrR family transcriptional regulator [Saprospiraceae bacterium]
MSGFSIELSINDKLYLRDPQRSEVGRRILRHSILLMDEIGLESFTFKKLAEHADTTEATIYRYFESKHLLLLYLINWYWAWTAVQIDMAVQNIEDAEDRLRRAIKAVISASRRNLSVDFIDKDVLHRIVVVEGTKAYHNKDVDAQNKEGFFMAYKALSAQLAKLILAVNPNFQYPKTLATNILEMAGNHVYFAEHLPRLTDVQAGPNLADDVVRLLESFTMKLIKVSSEKPIYTTTSPSAGGKRDYPGESGPDRFSQTGAQQYPRDQPMQHPPE